MAPRSGGSNSSFLVSLGLAESNFEIPMELQQQGAGVASGSIRLGPSMQFNMPILAADSYADPHMPIILIRTCVFGDFYIFALSMAVAISLPRFVPSRCQGDDADAGAPELYGSGATG